MTKRQTESKDRNMTPFAKESKRSPDFGHQIPDLY